MTAPAWPSSVSGRGSPKRGRLISKPCPSARSALPTRPGVERFLVQDDQHRQQGLAVEGRQRPLRPAGEAQDICAYFARLKHRLFWFAAIKPKSYLSAALISRKFNQAG